MSYFSTLFDGTQHESWFARHDARIVYLDIGRDSLLPRKFMLMVEMYPTDLGTEYAFGIVEQYYESNKMRVMFDSAETNALIPKSYRAAISEKLLYLTEKLVRGANMPNFFMVTYCDNLPEIALEKYFKLCDIFDRCGYEVTRTEPEPGKHFWFMSRREPQA